MGHPVEGQEVVLAQRLEGDVPGQDQFVVPLLVGERGQIERAGGQELGVGPGHPPRRVGEVFRRRIVPEGDE